MSFLTNILYDTGENQNFRTVLYTGQNSQLVIMSIPPEGEIGLETHDCVEQTFFFLSGVGIAILNDERREIHRGDILVVSPGTEHNVLNTGNLPLKIFTIYVPPNHLDGRIHATKADADRDTEDEAFGESIGGDLFIDSRAVGACGFQPPGFLPDVEP